MIYRCTSKILTQSPTTRHYEHCWHEVFQIDPCCCQIALFTCNIPKWTLQSMRFSKLHPYCCQTALFTCNIPKWTLRSMRFSKLDPYCGQITLFICNIPKWTFLSMRFSKGDLYCGTNGTIHLQYPKVNFSVDWSYSNNTVHLLDPYSAQRISSTCRTPKWTFILMHSNNTAHLQYSKLAL